MSIYVILGIVIAVIIASITFVIIGAIERHKKVNLNWLLLMTAIVLACTLCMVLIYHNQHDLTQQDIQQSYEQGYEDGKSSVQHTLPTNEEMEEWFSSTQKVVIGTNEGGDVAVHIIDGTGNEWVLVADK